MIFFSKIRIFEIFVYFLDLLSFQGVGENLVDRKF